MEGMGLKYWGCDAGSLGLNYCNNEGYAEVLGLPSFIYSTSYALANPNTALFQNASYHTQLNMPVVKGPAPKPSPQMIKAICTIDALNANNGLGLPTPSLSLSGSESVANGIVFQQSTQHGVRTMNPSSPNMAVMGPLAAPGIFVQNSYVNCLEHF